MSVFVTVPSRYPLNRSFAADCGRWWVLHIKPNCENLVATYLLSRQISYYFPVFVRKERIGYSRRIRTSRIPLFRGYICFALAQAHHHILFDSKNFVRILKVEDQDRLVRELESVDIAFSNGKDLSPTGGLVPGKRVLILNGPLRGAEGVVVKRQRQNQLVVSVTMFNQSIVVRLDPFTKVELLP